MASPDPTIFIVDDDPAVCDALVRLLSEVNLHCQVFSSAAAFLSSFDTERPGCLLLDVRMPGMSGVELQRELIKRNASLPIIFITGHGDVPLAVEAMKSGAFDFIEKPVRAQVLLERINECLQKDSESRRRIARQEQLLALYKLLTQKEREVVHLVAKGLTNRAIAAKFNVSSQAIDSHRARAMKKLGVESVPELVQILMAIQDGSTGP